WTSFAAWCGRERPARRARGSKTSSAITPAPSPPTTRISCSTGSSSRTLAFCRRLRYAQFMRWPLSEYLLKGVFPGLLVYAGLTAPVSPAAVGLAVGLGVGLLVAAADKLRRGMRPAGRPVTFLLFVLLESPGLIYAGVVVGLAVVAFALTPD